MRLVLLNGLHFSELASILKPFVIEIMSDNKLSTHLCSSYFCDYIKICFFFPYPLFNF